MVTAVRSGAEAVVDAAVARGVSVCFANPGTTEMPLVAALDSRPGLRAVLGLQENVCTGAADGYARVSGRPAATLLHLGPGLANGLANLHNAMRAHSPVVNVVGDHMTWHRAFDTPLTSDIAALARTVGQVLTTRSRQSVAQDVVDAVDEARTGRRVVTLIVPADHQQAELAEPPHGGDVADRPLPAVDGDRVRQVADALRRAGSRAVLLLGAGALSADGQHAAARIAAHLGATVYSETFPARTERGAGLPAVDRLPYFPERAVEALGGAEAVVVVGARPPVAYFGYAGTPSELAPAGSVLCLAGPLEDARTALLELADLVTPAPVPGRRAAGPVVDGPAAAPPDDTVLTAHSAVHVVAGALPEGAVVSVEGGTLGYPFFTAGATAAPHTVLTNTGGAIGQGLPCALGAAVAAPDRTIVALQSDGSGLYTAQALWTMARERARVVVLVCANRVYGVLRAELGRHGQSVAATQAAALTSLDDPAVDWVALATSFGVPASSVRTVGQLRAAFDDAVRADGPVLVEVVL
ncbi:acetolactate synthase large subunit [Kineosporia sp. A_224]|uniref:acetolactate synthase large subunit n=1 Tax=Kineosporia sp. A_224 TaxID=1962180 RepID=UPI000B4B2513|nr:acetolactate synthase large subunit [Kineosporia sp. A_224]